MDIRIPKMRLARDSLAFYFIQKGLDDSILFKDAATTTSKEAPKILKEKFDVRGSNTNIVVSQTIEAIVKPL